MRIAWFIPLRRQSAIGWTFGLSVARALAKHAHVDLWVPEPFDVPSDEFSIVPFQSSTLDETRLRSYDLVVYNLGDNYVFHADIYAVSERVPGIVVLHDFVMHNFFRGRFFLEGGGVVAYGAALERLYGTPGRHVAERTLAGDNSLSFEDLNRFPFIEDAIRSARGVITHSKFSVDRVRDTFAGPSTNLFLAYDVARTLADRELIGEDDGRALLVSIGYVNRNRHIDKVIRMLGEHPALARRVRYDVVGPSSDRAYSDLLEGLVKRYSLEETVRFSGYASDDLLHAYLSHADLCISLRNPPIEGASASVIEQMLYGRAVVVADNGFYAELPDDAVCKIEPQIRIGELAATVERLISSADQRLELGSRARVFVSEHATGEAWAASFFTFADTVLSSQPLASLIDGISERLILMDVSAESPLIDTLVEEAYSLFVPRPF